MSQLELPAYRLQPPEFAARFARLTARPVVLEVANLGKTFSGPQGDVVALEDIHFLVHRREFLCVIGPSGCGKSTLIRILAGLEAPTQGEVLIYPKGVSGPGPEAAMGFQGYTLVPLLILKGYVMFGLKMKA